MTAHIALIKGDGIGGDICDATLYLVNLALRQVGATALTVTPIDAGAAYFQDTGLDIEPNGEETAGACDAIFWAQSACHLYVTRTVLKFPRICGFVNGFNSMPGCGR